MLRETDTLLSLSQEGVIRSNPQFFPQQAAALMAEEQRCGEGHRLCANNCGFFGSPATMDLCSKCYRDLCLNEEQASSAKIAVEKSLLAPSSAPIADVPAVAISAVAETAVEAELAAPAAAEGPRRCAACRKRVGLTAGFECRCGATYCGGHRYPEQHGCTFDFKAAGRVAIAAANPVIKAEKLDKI